LSGNTVLELPSAREAFAERRPGWLEHTGGWQVSALSRFRSGLPVNITNGGVYPTNYLSAALAVLRPGAG
jgi:hypothetical protein